MPKTEICCYLNDGIVFLEFYNPCLPKYTSNSPQMPVNFGLCLPLKEFSVFVNSLNVKLKDFLNDDNKIYRNSEKDVNA